MPKALVRIEAFREWKGSLRTSKWYCPHSLGDLCEDGKLYHQVATGVEAQAIAKIRYKLRKVGL